MPALADKKKTTKRRAIKVVAMAGTLVVAGGAAFAWWTAGGSGTGSASTGTVSGITVNQTSTIAGLYPGGPAVALAGDFSNTNSGPVHVAQIAVAVQTDWTVQGDATKPACTAADLVLVQPTVTNADVASGSHVSAWSGASIRLANSATNQDNCKNITVPLVYTSN
jgi:hypothetical protein